MRLLLALAVVLLWPAGAEAAGPKIIWPEQRPYAAGETLKVKVVSKQRVRVALLRENARGKVLRTIARRTMRSGTFRVKLPRVGRYSLRVGARRRVVTVVACARRGDRAELRLGATAVRAGGTLPAEVVNTSDGCLTGGVGYLFERLQPDGAWARVPTDLVFAGVAVFIEAGTTFAKQVQIPADFAPGSYRLKDSVLGADGAIELTAPFDVVA